ncbi:acyl-CoA thioesterase [Amycolatopsis sp. CA-230715]|uniref:acyl-CoA thioesterase n=1 Tax=Amycolatopsis sp. CA-230715 TaxID=2745196 RepID=UPI003FA467E1
MSRVMMVRPRWSDMDSFRHVNHAKMVTLLEEARVPMLFADAGAAGLSEFAKGIVVVSLTVHYHAPVVVNGEDIRIEMSMRELKFSSFTLGYKVHNGPSESDKVAVTATTRLAPYDTATERPRRLSDAERDFLQAHLDEDNA